MLPAKIVQLYTMQDYVLLDGEFEKTLNFPDTLCKLLLSSIMILGTLVVVIVW